MASFSKKVHTKKLVLDGTTLKQQTRSGHTPKQTPIRNNMDNLGRGIFLK